MRYAVSDIHGCYDTFQELLKEINFTDKDELYILGDVIDRGPKPIKVLKYCEEHENIHLLMGNHEKMFLDALDYRETLLWYHNGGRITDIQIHEISDTERIELINYIRNLPYYFILEDIKTILVHAGITSYVSNNENTIYDILENSKVDESIVWQRNENVTVSAKKKYFDDYTLIHGHTPNFDGNFSNHYGVYNIDGACCYGGNLCCLNLDNLKEYKYINNKERV